jgi:hypothetical protein
LELLELADSEEQLDDSDSYSDSEYIFFFWIIQSFEIVLESIVYLVYLGFGI